MCKSQCCINQSSFELKENLSIKMLLKYCFESIVSSTISRVGGWTRMRTNNNGYGYVFEGQNVTDPDPEHGF